MNHQDYTNKTIVNVLQPILGKVVARPAVLHSQLANDILHCKKKEDPFKIVIGTTMCTLDFYEGKLLKNHKYYLLTGCKISWPASLNIFHPNCHITMLFLK